jgi:hypothetical protein
MLYLYIYLISSALVLVVCCAHGSGQSKDDTERGVFILIATVLWPIIVVIALFEKMAVFLGRISASKEKPKSPSEVDDELGLEATRARARACQNAAIAEGINERRRSIAQDDVIFTRSGGHGFSGSISPGVSGARGLLTEPKPEPEPESEVKIKDKNRWGNVV